MSLDKRLSAAKSQLCATMTKITSVVGQVYVEKNGAMTLQEQAREIEQESGTLMQIMDTEET